jgi:uncharacterized low-complexity protein
MKKSLIALSGAILLVMATPMVASAQSAPNLPAPPSNQAEVEARFKAADKNGDGKVTREEAEAGLPRVAMVWDKVDVDKKGYITLEQLLIISANSQ